MAQDIRLTIREVGESIQWQFGGGLIPHWRLRRCGPRDIELLAARSSRSGRSHEAELPISARRNNGGGGTSFV